MEDNKQSVNKRVFISYQDDGEQIVNGYVDLLEETELYVKFRTNKNIITLGRSRVIKIKEVLSNG